MGHATRKRDGYTRAERLSDATIHVIGVTSALIGVSVLVTLAAVWRGDKAAMTAIVIYGITLLGMLGASAAYHLTHHPRRRAILQRVDHSAIYLKIAGTYTPFAIFAGMGVGPFLASVWGVALAGLSLRVFAPGRYFTLGLILYLGLGWAGVLAGGDLLSSVSPTTMTLMVAGGAIYTIGVVFFLWEMLPFHNTIWHAFVLIATAIFYAAVVVELSDTRMRVDLIPAPAFSAEPAAPPA